MLLPLPDVSAEQIPALQENLDQLCAELFAEWPEQELAQLGGELDQQSSRELALVLATSPFVGQQFRHCILYIPRLTTRLRCHKDLRRKLGLQLANKCFRLVFRPFCTCWMVQDQGGQFYGEKAFNSSCFGS